MHRVDTPSLGWRPANTRSNSQTNRTTCAEYYNGKSSFAAAEAVEVSAGGTTSGIDAGLQASGEITGEVTSEASGQGIEVIEVVVYEAGGKARRPPKRRHTEAATTRFSGLRPGEYVVKFYSGVPGSNGKNYAKQYYPGQSFALKPNPSK